LDIFKYGKDYQKDFTFCNVKKNNFAQYDSPNMNEHFYVIIFKKILILQYFLDTDPVSVFFRLNTYNDTSHTVILEYFNIKE
jgi:hypothetical protein